MFCMVFPHFSIRRGGTIDTTASASMRMDQRGRAFGVSVWPADQPLFVTGSGPDQRDPQVVPRMVAANALLHERTS